MSALAAVRQVLKLAVFAQTVLDALRARKERFLFEGNEISLRNSVMAFITMNPGYPGRAELPESLKVRDCRLIRHWSTAKMCTDTSAAAAALYKASV